MNIHEGFRTPRRVQLSFIPLPTSTCASPLCLQTTHRRGRVNEVIDDAVTESEASGKASRRGRVTGCDFTLDFCSRSLLLKN